MKAKTAVAAVLFLMPAAAGLSFGSYPIDSDKTTGELQASFEIGLLNPGNQETMVRFSAPDSEDYNVSFPEKVRVEGTGVETDPSGNGWYSLGSGRYVKMERVNFEVEVSKYRSSNDLNIPVEVTASSASGEEGETTADVIYIQEHNFDLQVVDRRIRHRDEGLGWKEVNNDETTDEEKINESLENSSKTYKPTRDKPAKEESLDTVTIVLVAGILAMLAYILRLV